jgi:hypothetical protein
VQVLLSHKDAINDKVVQTTRSVIVSNTQDMESAIMTPAMPVADAAVISISPTGNSKLIVKSGSPVTVEIWRGVCKAEELEIAPTLHGPLISEGYCSTGPVWSPDESAVAYVAEVCHCR